MRDRKALAVALRKFADYIEKEDGPDLSPFGSLGPLAKAEDIAEVVDMLEAENDPDVHDLDEEEEDREFEGELVEAARDWHEREARGERAIPADEVRRILMQRRGA